MTVRKCQAFLNLRTYFAMRVVIVEHTKGNGRKYGGKVKEESGTDDLGNGLISDHTVSVVCPIVGKTSF